MTNPGIGHRVRNRREELGLSQAELADRAGVSRQLISSLENERHLPRVDAAVGIASVLGVEVADLFSLGDVPRDVLTGQIPGDGVTVRVGRVGEQVVTTPSGVGDGGWEIADAIASDQGLTHLTRLRPGPVIAGCEPGLQLLEGALREGGIGAVAVTCSSASAIDALQAGRVHAAVVHRPARSTDQRIQGGVEIERLRMCRWRVGLAAPHDADGDWRRRALAGEVPVIQREPGAAVQASFEHAAGDGVPGPRVRGHVSAARTALATGIPAVTIEPAALAFGLEFAEIETHEVDLLVDRHWLRDGAVEAALDELVGRRFAARLTEVGGYDLSDIGGRRR